MTEIAIESVSFTDLSRNPRAVAEKANALGYVRVTHRDAPDMLLATAALARCVEESLTTASRLFLALAKNSDAVDLLLVALRDVFPWVRHLADEEAREFVEELLGALADDAELGTQGAVHRAIVSWRATARINADPTQRTDAMQPLSGDVLGRVEVSE